METHIMEILFIVFTAIIVNIKNHPKDSKINVQRILLISCLIFTVNFGITDTSVTAQTVVEPETEYYVPQTVPEGELYIEINDNVPYFTDEDISSTDPYEEYGELDELGRVTAANAVLGVELMPSQERGDISAIKPTGWDQARYGNISGGWLYNRAHLIGHQLTGEDANPKNLMTGTRWFNMEGMLPFENYVAFYIESTENHVRYRITPVFEDDNLLASGVYMEGFSIEDNGESLQFNIYVPNRQPDVVIDYADGSSIGPEGPTEEDTIKDLPAEDKSIPPATAPAETGDISTIDTNGNGTVTIKEAETAGFKMPVTNDHWLYQYMTDGDGDGMVGE